MQIEQISIFQEGTSCRTDISAIGVAECFRSGSIWLSYKRRVMSSFIPLALDWPIMSLWTPKNIKN